MKSSSNKPPGIARMLLCRLRNRIEHESLIGDYDEMYSSIREESGYLKAWFWYWSQVMRSLPGSIFSKLRSQRAMLKNYIVITVRNIFRNKTQSFVNISGLAVGLACCMLIMLYVQHELSYDRFHAESDRTYRIVGDSINQYITFYRAGTPNAMAPVLRRIYPEIEHTARLGATPRILINYGDKRMYEDRVFVADPDIFDVFTFDFVKGDPSTALISANSMIITEETAERYFGSDEPMGKVLIVNNNSFNVSAIVKSFPENSHFKFDIISDISSGKILWNWPAFLDSWSSAVLTYVVLKEGIAPESLEAKFPDFIEQYYRHDLGDDEDYKFSLQPLTSIHLNSNRSGELEVNGDIANVYMFSIIALIVILIASINYMNLATARVSVRIKELGMRKVVGARKSQLISQFLGESMALSMIAFAVAFVLAKISLPIFNDLTGTALNNELIRNTTWLAAVTGIALFVGLASGIYPAFILSSFSPLSVLKGKADSGLKGVFFRKFLVTIQFAASIALIISSLVVYEQLEYIQNKKLGYQKEQMLIVTMRDRNLGRQYESIRNEITKNAAIQEVTFSSAPPNNIGRNSTVSWEGSTERMEVKVNFVDYDFFNTYSMEMTEGRYFSKDLTTDAQGSVIVNEAFVRHSGMEDPIGKWFSRFGRKSTIIGVMKDFHFESLRNQIAPLTLHIAPEFFRFISIKMNTDNIPESISYLENVMKGFSPDRPFEYFFLDDNFDQQYRAEARLVKTFGYFTSIAIFISCLGLFGLVLFSAEQRTKEIGIRKVLGSTASGVAGLIAKDFLRPVVVANLIAWPSAYFIMSGWLDGFAFRADMGLSTFFMPSIAAFVIALFTVSYQVLRSAYTNPVDTLRYE